MLLGTLDPIILDAIKVEGAHIAVAKIENTYLGTTARYGMNTWKLRQNEYNVGATFAVTERASNTVRNLPKPPEGLSMASSKPPTLPLS